MLNVTLLITLVLIYNVMQQRAPLVHCYRAVEFIE